MMDLSLLRGANSNGTFTDPTVTNNHGAFLGPSGGGKTVALVHKNGDVAAALGLHRTAPIAAIAAKQSRHASPSSPASLPAPSRAPQAPIAPLNVSTATVVGTVRLYRKKEKKKG